MVEVGFAPPEERMEIAMFMDKVFHRAKWDLSGWLRLLDGRWAKEGDPVGLTVRDDGKLVGVIGYVAATRPPEEGNARVVGLTSWYLMREYRGRGLGQELLKTAMADPSTVFTNFTSARAALPSALASGYELLDDTRFVWPSSGKTPPLSVRDAADDTAQIIRDHAGLNMVWRAVDTPDGPVTVALSIKKKHEDYITHEVLYVSDGDLFVAHAQAIADSLLPASGAVFSIDSRFAPGAKGTREAIPMPRLYKPGLLPLHHIDFLYSEIVLLDMKLP